MKYVQGQQRRDIKDIIYKLEAETGVTAHGFFDVNRSMLTMLVGNILTYLVVLIQFKPTFNSFNE